MIRNKSSIPISVGTGLALEILPGVKMYKYHTLLINVRTIIRNARQAFDGDTLPSESDLYEAVKEDIVQTAEFIVAMKLKTTLELKFYYPSYRGLPKEFPMAKIKEPLETKGKQLEEAELDNKVGKKITSEFGNLIINVDSRIPHFNGQALIMTHHPVDLVTTDSYTRLELLESHTGKIKNYTLFYSKLTGSKDLTNIPMNKLTIQLFGDNSTNFYANSYGLKNTIKQLAESARWSTASTPSLVARSIRSLPDSPEKEILLKMI